MLSRAWLSVQKTLNVGGVVPFIYSFIDLIRLLGFRRRNVTELRTRWFTRRKHWIGGGEMIR